MWEDIRFLAVRDRPKTAEEYAKLLNKEGRPTPSGKGRWSDKLVQRYMTMFDSNSKKLLTEFPERSKLGFGYPPDVYAALRAEIMGLNAVDETNGVWISAIEAEPSSSQPVLHTTHGHGDFIERVNLASIRCQFIGVDTAGDAIFVEHDCRPVDLRLFVYHRSADERRLAAADFWKRLIRDHEQGYRRLIDGWHL